MPALLRRTLINLLCTIRQVVWVPSSKAGNCAGPAAGSTRASVAAVSCEQFATELLVRCALRAQVGQCWAKSVSPCPWRCRVQAIVAAANAGGAEVPGGGGLDMELAASGFQREHAEALDRWVAAASRQPVGSEGEGKDDAEEGASSSGDEEGLAEAARGPAAESPVAAEAEEEEDEGESASSSSAREEGEGDAGSGMQQLDRWSPAEELAECLRLNAGPHAKALVGSGGSSRQNSEAGSAEARESSGSALERKDATAEGPRPRVGGQLAAGEERSAGAGVPAAGLEGSVSGADGVRARGAAERRTVQDRVQGQARARARTAASQRASRGSMKAAVKKGRRQAAGGAVF